MIVFEEEGQVIEFGTIEDTDGAPGILVKGDSIIGMYVGAEEKLEKMPNILGKKVRIIIEII